MLTPVKTHPFLKNVLYEITEARESSSVPEWAAGKPLAHHILIYITRGNGQLSVNGQLIKLERESLHMHPPGACLKLHTGSREEELQCCWISFDMYRLTEASLNRREYCRELGFPLHGELRIGGIQFKRLFYLLIAEGKLKREQHPYLSQQYVHDMLDGLLRYAEPAAPNDADMRLKLTLDYLQNHYREEIRIDKLAELAQLHPAYYSQVFKQAMDKSPVAFLTHLRINKAKELLLQTDKSIRDIAAEVGYKDEFYFSRRFKESSGYSPRVFAKKNDKKIISLSAPYTDHLYTLGLKPCAAQLHRHLPMTTISLTLPEHAADPWGISREAFLAEQPDLIVCKDNVLNKARKHINDIAPIVAVPWLSQDVYTHLMHISELVNREAEAVQWLQKHERSAEKIRKKLRPSVGSGTVAVCVCREHELRMYGARNIGHVFYRSLQLAPPERIQRQIDLHPAGTAYNWTAIEPDGLKDYDADFIFFAVETEGDKRRVFELIKTDSAWKRHSAIKNKRVYFIDWEKWMMYAPFLISQQLEEAARLLSQSPSLRELI
ncbi:helix-turn-helix domain-containing protein [Paenibacillus sp. S150]|uniref:helix-turn-helix domain-containing protein n=1 Tax=Paenibacillus sp. S150 TaxID=2749826 RepID=UPI001C59A9B3|nr:helix-turn-helix domain-containing protein [Paenibacillus sp. S150]MBW4080661.1 helix-turn-helix domain-containing protein [Paenibacillus sp. S150]